MRRTQFRGAGQFGDAILDSAPGDQRVAQAPANLGLAIGRGFGVAATEFERGAEAGHGSGQIARPVQRLAEQQVSAAILRQGGDGGPRGVENLVPASEIAQAFRQIVVGRRCQRIDTERSVISVDGGFRLAQPPKQRAEGDPGLGAIRVDFQRLANRLGGGLDVAEIHQRRAEIVERRGEPRANRQSLPVRGDRPGQITAAEQHDTEIVVRVGVAGFQLESAAIGSGRPVAMTGQMQGQPQFVMNQRLLVQPGGGIAEQGNRALVMTEIALAQSEIEQRPGFVGLLGESGAEGRGGFGDSPQPQQHRAPAAQQRRVVGRQQQGGLEQPERALGIAFLIMEHAKEMQRLGVPALLSQHAGIKPARRHQIARAMGSQRGVQQSGRLGEIGVHDGPEVSPGRSSPLPGPWQSRPPSW